MKKDTIKIEGMNINVYSVNTAVVGSGASGFNAIDTLYDLGIQNTVLVTEGINKGTSRNTGSDKQTYYKLNVSGDIKDSVYDMAKTLFSGGAMHGDIALVEAASSTRCFFKLCSLGVSFPHNKYGEYVGYKTDHDPTKRATSAGPLTSKYMTEKLEKQVKAKNINIMDGYQVIGIITEKKDDLAKAIGMLAINLSKQTDENMGFTLFNCKNIIYATGGPAGIYKTSVYPKSQMGATGVAFEAGAEGVNLTESQYGIASIKFRWNLSGTYQQVIPRYISTKADGSDEREFLDEYFEDKSKMLDAIFLKGYQWPFDPRKIENFGSSLIDILVYNETVLKNRRVFLDFTKNPKCALENNEFDFSMLGKEAYEYLENSDVLFGTPIARLSKMNKPAIDLYLDNGIDISKEYLEIAVCAQHNNGGLKGNIWWESNIKNLFPTGEVNGTFGVYRPGGTALNSTQVGSLRASQYISKNYSNDPYSIKEFEIKAKKHVMDKIKIAKSVLSKEAKSNIYSIREELQSNMTKSGANIRTYANAIETLTKHIRYYENFLNEVKAKADELNEAFINRDILITQIAYLSSIVEYIKEGGKSRGSYLIGDKEGVLPIEKLDQRFRFSIDTGEFSDKVCNVFMKVGLDSIEADLNWEAVREIPNENNWFEKVWNDYMNDEIIN